MAPTHLVKQARKDARKDAAAAHRLAGWYSRDLSLWLRWEVEAAERGCADARYALGGAYCQGSKGVQVAPAIAFAWFRKAALQGKAFPTWSSSPALLSA